MATWRIEDKTRPGIYYQGTGNLGITWTSWLRHAAFGNRQVMRGILAWLTAQGYKCKLV